MCSLYCPPFVFCAMIMCIVCSDCLCIMARKRNLSAKDAPSNKKARKSITFEQKMDILRRYDRGESTASNRNALNLPESTLRTTRKDREKIMAAVKAGARSGSTKVSSSQSNIMVRMEMMLVTSMDHRKRLGINMTFDDTRNKVMESFNYLKEKETSPVPNFVSSMGWFCKFKMRYGFHSIKHSGEAKSTDKDTTASHPDRLKATRGGGGGFKPQQVLNMDEMGLQWKKMPECMYSHL